MLSVNLEDLVSAPRHVLCLGAHPDDLEIGCGGTVIRLMAQARPPAVTWVVFTADARREAEAVNSAETLLRGAARSRVIVHKFRDGFLPHEGAAVKEAFEDLKAETAPDLILTHQRGDLHQDHRVISELTWNTFRDHTILEYEIPKYDGDMGAPNFFVTLDETCVRRKIDAILAGFPSQAGHRWFTEETFRSLLRLRGLECNAPGEYAEAFYCRKLRAA